MTKTVRWYGPSFSTAANDRILTGDGFDFDVIDVDPWPWSGDQSFFFSKQMSDGTIIIPSQPQKYSAFNPTGDTLEFARFYPDTGVLEAEIIPTSTGVLHPKSTSIGTGNQVGGADFEDACIYFVNGEERLLLSVGRHYNDWWIGAGPGGGVPDNQGIYPCHVVLRKLGGIWTYSAADSRYPADYLASNPAAATSIYFATTTPVTGEAYTAARQLVEMGLFPQSNDIIQCHYDDRTGIGHNSGAMTVVGDDGGGAGLQLKAGYLLPNVDWPIGNRISVRARSPKPDPSSALNAEDFVMEPDVLSAANPVGALLSGETNCVITTPDSAAWQVAGVHRFVVWVEAQDYSQGSDKLLGGHFENVGNQRGWGLFLASNGELRFCASNNGTALTINAFTNTAANGNVSAALTDGVAYYLGFEIDTTTGTLKFYKAADAATTPALWAGFTQIGTNVAAGPITYHNSTAALSLGGTGTLFGSNFAGWIRRAQLWDDGVLIANYDASPSGSPLAAIGTGTYTDSTGKVWTHRSGARVIPANFFDAIEFRYNAGAGTIVARSQPFWPMQGGQNPEQAQFDEVGNLYISGVFGGQFNGPVAIYEKSGGTHAYNAFTPSGAWLTGDGSLTYEWGRFIPPTTEVGASIGATSTGLTWDNASKIMYYATSSGILAIQRFGGSAPYEYEYQGRVQIHTADEPATHIMRPLVDHARHRIWLPVGQGYTGAYPPATPPDLAQWIVSAPLEFWVADPVVDASVLTWPVRAESIAWRAYDSDMNPLGDLMVSVERVPTITNDTTRAIRRNVPSLTIPPRPLVDRDPRHIYAEDVNPLSMRVQPWWLFSDGTEHPLGVFVWGDDSTVQWSSGSPRYSMLSDLCSVLDQPLDDSTGWGQGTSVRDAILDVLDAENISTEGVEASDAVFGVAVGFVAGRDTFLTALDGLCKNAGFLPPYFDNFGILRCRAAPNIASANPEFRYGFGLGGVIPGSAVFSNDLLTAPNRYVVVGGNPDAELVGIFDVPAAAPNSYENIGRRRRKTDTVQGISNQAQADQAAVALYASDISTYTWLSFDARSDPRHDTWNIVAYDDVPYREVGWSMECKPGGKMNHALRGTYA